MEARTLGIMAPHPPIMVPEVGGSRAGVTADSATAMRTAARALEAFRPDAVVLMSPHAPVLRDAFAIDDSPRTAGDLGAFGAPQVHIDAPGDPELALAIAEEARAAGLPVVLRQADRRLAPGVLDHGALVPLSFLDRAGAYPLVEISLAFLPLRDHHTLGRAIRSAARRLGRRVAFLASGDCSHRLTRDAPAGYSPRGAEFDRTLVELVRAGDLEGFERIDPGLVEAAGECGLRSFVTLAGFVQGADVTTEFLAYEGPWGVGYLTAIVSDAALSGCGAEQSAATASGAVPEHDDVLPGAVPGAPTAESPPVALARRTIEVYVRDHRTIEPPQESGLLGTRAGAFVSLHRGGMLRGCIGTIEPTEETLASEIVRNAIRAATRDPRFPPLDASELDDLEISVDVLQPPEPADVSDLDPRRWGVIVSSAWRRGLLLPDLEGVDTVAEQLSIARRKAGIGPDEPVRIERFGVDRYH
jgi:AmmeMemoRadiSam system protein A